MTNKKSKLKTTNITVVWMGLLALSTAGLFKDSFSAFFKIVLSAVPLLCFIFHFIYTIRNKRQSNSELENKIKTEAAIYSRLIFFYLMLFFAIYFTLFPFDIPAGSLLSFSLYLYIVIIYITEISVENKYL